MMRTVLKNGKKEVMSTTQFLLATLVAGTMFTTACSIKASSGGGDGGGGGFHGRSSKDKVQGPALDGTWLSNCTDGSFGSGSKTIQLVVVNRKIVRTEIEYSDSNCATLKSSRDIPGTFHYIAEKKGDVFQIEYFLKIGKNATQYITENIRLDNSGLWISDFSDYDPTLLLKRQDSANNTTPSKPAPKETPKKSNVKDFSPSLGDTVTYVDSSGGTKLYSNNGPSDNGYSVYVETNGIPKGNREMAASDMMSTELYKSIIAGCNTDIRKLETIQVKAGSFDTCRVEDNGYYIWYGNIPLMGIVKQEALDKSFSMELKSFGYGN
jgi:hypothetical protein